MEEAIRKVVDDYDVNKKNRKTEYMDNADRVEVERSFSLLKRCYGLDRIMTKLDVTTKSSIALSILLMLTPL